ncbi:metallophosphoesterase family protein [Pseudomonas edaphica]|uniref:Metallophosphoesterase family protein n=1 Tax=Pseudomonas edaphica TaxID=2006980 RepID=A0A7Y8FKG7_9PSED|nr:MULTISPECIES: metallophosphoesterase family protein [Pseudomonas]MBI6947592.1 metallophosphoesterase family protein [Pseudomonas koreensis]NWC47146.1 metallophosphoesterase family protein [Pseudomonas sp. IPO3747]NWE09736.1 metallophosphoesterase family protein [Pseudomonas edaphica]NWE80810.1 metallophosphoesterase family protein [Pseudomonas edaphica]
MKIQIFSDLHLGFARFEPAPSDADVVILAGDIDIKSRGVNWANDTFQCPVIYVCGNHEFYGGHIDHTLRKMKEAAAPHVHVLENETLILDKTRFLVTTAWTDYSSTGDVVAAKRIAWEWMNDFRVIRADENYRRLRPDDLITRYKTAYQWLARELDKPFDGKTVVVTHHAPALDHVGNDHPGHLVAAYANHWPELLEKADLWIYGHTHVAADFSKNGCRVVSNPRGYPKQITGFDPNFLVEI